MAKIPQNASFDVQEAFRAAWAILDRFDVQRNLDMRGGHILDNPDGTLTNHLVTVRQLTKAVDPDTLARLLRAKLNLVDPLKGMKIDATGYSRGSRQTNSANQSLVTATPTVITFDTVSYDNDAMAGSNKVTIKTAGRYNLIGLVSFAANATGYRFVGIKKNGGATAFVAESLRTAVGAGAAERLSCVGEDQAVVGDYYELIAEQTSGGNLNSETIATARCPALVARQVG